MVPEIQHSLAETHERSTRRLRGLDREHDVEAVSTREGAPASRDDAPRMQHLFNRLHLSIKYYEILAISEGFTNPAVHGENLAQAVRHASAIIWDILKKTTESPEELDDERLSFLLIALMKLSAKSTFEHSLRVMNWSTALAGKLNLNSDLIHGVRQGALFRDIGKTGIMLLGTCEEDRRTIGELLRENCHILNEGGGFHDIGKLRIPPEILNKPSPLNTAELAVMKQHPIIGEEILRPIRSMEKVLPAVRNHHEKWDGSGYPDRLAGRAIPVIARIICITDSFDAMTSDRPYRKALSNEQAVEELKKNAGSQFDPTLVDLFLEILDDERA